MTTPRERLLVLAQAHTTKYNLPDVDIERFNKGVEFSKDAFEDWLKTRRVPMLKSGLVFRSIAGQISPERRDTILTELEDEKRIKCNHSPDGLDTWEVPSQDDLVFVGNLRGEDMYATKMVAFLIDGLNDSIKHLQGVIRCDQ